MKAHIETDKQYAKRISNLHFTNDCDPDMTICELQHWLDKAESILKTLSQTEEPNGEYFKQQAKKYFANLKQKGEK